MRYSKTTIRELSAKYRSVLKKCFLLNAMAMGLIVATSASASITSDVTFNGKYSLADDPEGVKSGNIAIAPSAASYTYSYTDSSSTVHSNIASDEDPNKALFTYTKAGGTAGTLNDSDVQTIDYYVGSPSAKVDNTLVKSTQTIAAGEDVNYGNYSYLGGDGTWVDLTSTSVARDMSETVTTNSTYTETPQTITITNGVADGTIDATKYTFKVNSDSSTVYYLNADGTKALDADGYEVTISPGSDLETAFSAAQSAYNTDSANVASSITSTTTKRTNEEANLLKAQGAVADDTSTVATLTARYATLTTAQNLLTTAQNAQSTAIENFGTDTASYAAAHAVYESSVLQTIETGANSAISTALADGGAVKTAIDNAVAYDNTTSGLTATTMQGAIDENALAITTLNGNDETAGSVAYAVKQLADGAVADNTSAIATLNGNDETAGSVAYAVKQLADGAVADNASAIATLNGDDETAGSVAYAVKQLADGAVADNTSAIATLNGDDETAGSVAYAVKQLADGVVANNTSAIATLNGDKETTGSVAYAIDQYAIQNIGTVHGLIADADATTTSTDKAYAGNLAVGTTVEDHLLALDAAIGDMRGFGSQHYATDVSSVAANLTALDDQVYANTTAIGTTDDGTYVAAGNTIGQNLNALDTALNDVANNLTTAQADNNIRFAQIDHRIDKLEDKMEKGLAATAALTGLSPLPSTEHKTQISAAMGGYGSNQAVAVGAFHYINDRTLLNAGAAYGGNSNVSYKVGVTFGF